MSISTKAVFSGRRWMRSALLLVSVAIVAIVFCVFVLPYVWIVVSGLKNQTQIFADTTPLSWKTFLPLQPTFDNVAALFTSRGLAHSLLNSFIVAVFQVIWTAILCSSAAYALTRINFRGRNVVFAIILATFMLPLEALVVPLYNVITGLGLQDTLTAIWLPWGSSAFALFLLRQSFEQIPSELDEAARLDGAGHFRIFWSIILPNVKTAMATLCLVIFLASWNAFLWPLVAVQSPSNQVVQVAIASVNAPGQVPNWGLTFAGAAIATLPLIALFLALQRFFVQGLATSGLK